MYNIGCFPYLHSGFRKPQSLTELLPHKGVWVVSFVKQSLQLVQLFQSEVGTATSLFQLWLIVIFIV